MINKPEYDRNLQYWKVVWGKATFHFVSYENAFTFYEQNKENSK